MNSKAISENTAVKNERSAAEASEGIALGNAWTRFWFTAIPQTGMRCLRVIAGTVILCWLLSFLGHHRALFSVNGLVDFDTHSQLQGPEYEGTGPIGWSILYVTNGNPAAFEMIYWLSIAIVLLFTLGVATRLTAAATWVITVSFLYNPATSYEGDYMIAIVAFYMMLGHLFAGFWNGDLSLAEKILGSKRDFLFANVAFGPETDLPAPSTSANWMLRMLQIHFVMIMLANGLHKFQLADWWAGVALWYPLHAPFQTTAESIMRERPTATFTLFWLSLFQYAVLAWQIGFPTFAWKPGWPRVILLGGAAAYWFGMFFVFRLPLFGPFVVIGCLSYLRPEEWAAIADRATGWMKRETPRLTKAQIEAKKPAPLANKEAIKK